MVGTSHNPESSGTADKEIHKIIHEEVVAAIRVSIPKMFGFINTTLIETFDELYVAVTEAVVSTTIVVVAAARL